MATWAEAVENVVNGNVRTANNDPLLVVPFNANPEAFSVRGNPVLDLQWLNTPVGEEVYMEFKDGSKVGITKGVSGLEMWYALTGKPTPYTTSAGTPVSVISYRSVISAFTVQTSTTIEVYQTTQVSMCFNFYAWNSSVDTSNIQECTYVSAGLSPSGGSTYTYLYDGSTAYGANWGATFNSQDWIDWLAGDTNAPTVYPGDHSNTGGGEGTFTDSDCEILVPSFPSIQAIDFGFVSIYNPSASDLRALASWLWSNDFEANIKKNYMSPFENILSLGIVPLNISASPTTLTIGNVTSNLTMPKVTNEYIEVDCGTVDIPEKWGSFLDYDTNYSIWLPFIGFRSLKPDDMSGGTLSVVYHIDILTGTGVCYILGEKPYEARNSDKMLKKVLYTYNCNILYQIPISGANFMNMYNQQLNATANGLNNFVGSVGRALSGDIIGGITSLFTGQEQAKRQYDTAKPDYGRSGNMGGSTGLFSTRFPYIVRSRPWEQVPNHYKELQGIPSQIYATLDTLSGYTEIETVICDTLTSCTQDEKNEIVRMLKEGVIL